MQLITKTVAKTLPAMYATEEVEDPVVKVKLFTPWAGWTWFLTDYDPATKVAFGYAHNARDPQGAELGYFSIAELESIKGPFGLKVEREIHWIPKPLSKAKAEL